MFLTIFVRLMNIEFECVGFTMELDGVHLGTAARDDDCTVLDFSLAEITNGIQGNGFGPTCRSSTHAYIQGEWLVVYT